MNVSDEQFSGWSSTLEFWGLWFTPNSGSNVSPGGCQYYDKPQWHSWLSMWFKHGNGQSQIFGWHSHLYKCPGHRVSLDDIQLPTSPNTGWTPPWNPGFVCGGSFYLPKKGFMSGDQSKPCVMWSEFACSQHGAADWMLQRHWEESWCIVSGYTKR
jgi:hypothetical protein